MSSNDGGWKVAKPKNPQHQQASKRQPKNTKPSQFTATVSSQIFNEIDHDKELFAQLTEIQKEHKVKELWGAVRKSVMKIISAPDFTTIITPIYHSLNLATSVSSLPPPSPSLSPLVSLYPLTSPTTSRITLEDSPSQAPLDTLGDILQRFHATPPDDSTPLSPHQTPTTGHIDFRSTILPMLFSAHRESAGLVKETCSKDIPSNLDGSTTPTISPQTIISFTHSSFGIGSISKSNSSLLQFAVYLIIITLFPTPPPPPPPKDKPSSPSSIQLSIPLIYDPMFTPLDCLLFDKLGLQVLENTEGRIPAPWDCIFNHESTTMIKHISFIPHCPVGISHNLIHSLWDYFTDGYSMSQNETGDESTAGNPSSALTGRTHLLNNLILIANSFDQILTKVLVPNHFYHLDEYLPLSNTDSKGRPQGSSKNSKQRSKRLNIEPLAIPTETLVMLYPNFTRDPHFYSGLDQYYEYIGKMTQPSETTTTTSPLLPPPPPTLSLSLLKPWTREKKISFSSHNNVLNDLSAHSFTFLLKNQVASQPSLEQFPSTILSLTPPHPNILFHLCKIMPSYTPPMSLNPELIPASLRSK